MGNRDFLISNGILRLYIGEEKDVVIPDGVVRIGKSAFEGSAIESVVIPDSVQVIGRAAFSGCAHLMRVDMGNGVERIHAAAFQSCERLWELKLSARLSTLGTWAFLWCDALERIVAPATLASKPFSWWYEYFPIETVYAIGFSNFGGDSTVHYRAKRNPEEAMRALLSKGMASAVPDLLALWKRVPTETLQALLAVAQELENTEAVARILEYRTRQYSAKELARIERYRTERALGERPLTVADWKKKFRYEITEDGGIRLLRFIAGARRGVLAEDETLLLPTRIGNRPVTGIDPESFFPALLYGVQFAVEEDNPFFSVIDGDLYSKDGRTLILYAPCARRGGEFTVPAGVREIGEYAFCWRGVETVVLSEGVRRIGAYAFRSAGRLLRVQLPASLTEIGAGAFLGCGKLVHVTLPSHLRRIERDAFYGCEQLKDVLIPDSVRSIGEEAFAECTQLQRVHLGHGVKALPKRVFENCRALCAVTLCRELEHIHWGAFWHCDEAHLTVLYDGTEAELQATEQISECEFPIEILRDAGKT